MRFKGARPQGGLQEIARQLKVDALIEGSVLRSGERVRVTTQLNGVAPERHLWAESYERDLRDVLTLQGELTRAIAQQVQAELTPQEEALLGSTTLPAMPRSIFASSMPLALTCLRRQLMMASVEVTSRIIAGPHSHDWPDCFPLPDS